MPFIFSNLKSIYNSLVDENESRTVFTFSFNNKDFSCLFIIDIIPYRLILLPLGQTFAIEVQINTDFSASTYIENYKMLVKFLELKYDENNKFSPKKMFEVINNNVCKNNVNPPHYSTVIKAERKCRKIEEEDKIFFCGLRNNSKNDSVSPQNYEKTRIAFGDDIANLFKRKNISTRWTDIKNKENLHEINNYLEKNRF